MFKKRKLSTHDGYDRRPAVSLVFKSVSNKVFKLVLSDFWELWIFFSLGLASSQQRPVSIKKKKSVTYRTLHEFFCYNRDCRIMLAWSGIIFQHRFTTKNSSMTTKNDITQFEKWIFCSWRSAGKNQTAHFLSCSSKLRGSVALMGGECKSMNVVSTLRKASNWTADSFLKVCCVKEEFCRHYPNELKKPKTNSCAATSDNTKNREAQTEYCVYPR